MGARSSSGAKATGVPQEIRFQTKPEIALQHIRIALAERVPAAPLLADAAYGNDTGFREGFIALGFLYAVGIQSSTERVATRPRTAASSRSAKGIGRPTTLLRRDEKHQPLAVSEFALSLPASAWRRYSWREGTRQPLRSRFAALRVRAAHRDYWRNEPRSEQWLLIEWPKQEAEPTKYWLSLSLLGGGPNVERVK